LANWRAAFIKKLVEPVHFALFHLQDSKMPSSTFYRSCECPPPRPQR
jgi:hypothetical protein